MRQSQPNHLCITNDAAQSFTRSLIMPGLLQLHSWVFLPHRLYESLQSLVHAAAHEIVIDLLTCLLLAGGFPAI